MGACREAADVPEEIVTREIDEFFERLTRHRPHAWQARLASDSTCQDALIRIPTGFGKTAGVAIADQRASRLPIADPLLEGDDSYDDLAGRDSGLAAVAGRGETSPALAADSGERGGEHGVRGRAGESGDAGSGTRPPAAATRHIEAALGILIYSELAPHLARRQGASRHRYGLCRPLDAEGHA